MSKLRMAIWGCGGYAGAHARKFKANPDVQVAALCSRSEANMKSLIERRLAEVDPPPALYTDPTAMFAEAGLDGVAILTPHTLHFEHAVQALEAGCHVLVEKPMVTKTDDAYALAEKVKTAGKVLVIGYNTAFTPACRYVRDAVRDGRFGKLEMVTAYLSQDWKRLTQGMWRHDPALSGGGQAYDSGAHLLNTVCWCVESRVADVMAYLDNQDADVDINSVMSIRFKNGVLASVAISGNCPPDGSHASFIFDGGRIDVDGWLGEWLRAWKGQEEVTDLPDCGAEANPNDNFADAILGRAEPLCTVQNGIIQCELMDAVYESAASGRPARPSGR
jgi:predicted dehydrogenase